MKLTVNMMRLQSEFERFISDNLYTLCDTYIVTEIEQYNAQSCEMHKYHLKRQCDEISHAILQKRMEIIDTIARPAEHIRGTEFVSKLIVAGIGFNEHLKGLVKRAFELGVMEGTKNGRSDF